MTIVNSLSPARAQAFHTTQSAQRKEHGPVQFSLPPVNDRTAPPVSTSSPTRPITGAAPPSLTQLPIASPATPISSLSPARPVTGVAPPSLTQLPIASPATPIGSLSPAGGASAPGTAQAVVSNQGNVVSARLISRLYQQPG